VLVSSPGLLTALAAAVVAVLVCRRVVRWRFESRHARLRPTDARGVVIGADAFTLPGRSGKAVLLLHGFNDTPQSMAYLGQQLHAAGYTAHAPRLPGHGCTLPVMAREARADAWRQAVRDAYERLAREHAQVYLCGQSMGGALAVLEALARPELPALVLLAPYLGMPRNLQRRLPIAAVMQLVSPYHTSTGGARSLHDPDARAEARGPGVVTAQTLSALRDVAMAAEAQLPQLTVPTLYVQSREDNRIALTDAERDFAQVGSAEKALVWLTGCGHIISADYCKDETARLVIDWLARHDGTTGGATPGAR
jgi:carboxylesterase